MGKSVTGPRHPFRDGTLRVDLIAAAVVAVGLAVTGWLIRDELHRGSAAGEQDVAVGVAESIVGAARRRPGTSLVWSYLEVGESLERGDGVFVADDSALDIHFNDGSHLMVSESSLVVVDLPESAAGVSARVDVRSGSVAGRAGARGLVFEVHGSSVSLAGGGIANVSGGAEGARVSVEKGKARVRDRGGDAAEVGARQTTAITAGVVAAVRDLTVELVVPAAGTTVFFTGDAAEVSFSWSGGAGLLEVADDAAFATVVRRRSADASAAVSLPAGGYFWRVTAGGEPLSAARAINVVRDDPPAPLQPATDAVVYFGAKEPATFAWSKVTGVARYRVELSSTRDFRKLAYAAEVDGPHLRFDERLEEGDYFWRVRSLAAERGESPWSVPVPFKLAVDPLPRAPELYDSEVEVIERGSKTTKKRKKKRKNDEAPSPSPKLDEGASLLYRLFIGGVAHAAAPSAAIVLRWEAVPGVRRYVLEIAEDQAFERVVVREQLTQSWYRWRKISKREYWWRVKSVDAKGREGVFSQPRSVGAVLTAPQLVAPAPAASVRIAARVPTVGFSWNGQRLAARYEWSIAKDAAFTRGAVARTTRASKLDWKPDAPGIYFWRVRAADAGGSFAPYSKTYRLEVELAAPVLRSSPARVRMTVPPPKVPLRARPVATATGYEVEVAADAGFAQPIRTRVKEPAWAFEPEVAGIWWWRIRARSGGVHSKWTEPTEIDVALERPVITAPANEAEIGFRAAETPTQIAWQPVPGAVGFEVVLTSNGAEVARIEAAANEVEVPGLAAGSYGVRVRALRASGPVAESEWVTFERVQLPMLAMPVLEEPVPDAWVVVPASGGEVPFRWQTVEGAGTYDLEVAVADGEWRSSRETTATALRTELGYGVYRWRVRAVDDAGMPGGFSEPVAFRLGPSPPATAEIDIEPEPVSPDAADVRIDILLRDEDGQPVVGTEVEAAAARGSIHDLRGVGEGRWVARYRPPSDFGEGDDTVAVTVPGLAAFRVEESVRLAALGGTILFGGSVGLVSNFGAVLSPTAHLEVGYRLPVFDGRLIAGVRGGYHYTRKTRTDPRATANQYSVPIALGLKLEFPRWLVVPYGSVNLLIGIMVGRLKVAGQDEIFRTEVGVGGELGLGGAFALGPGDLFAEIRYGWMRRTDDEELFELDGGGLVPVIGYRVEL